MLAYIKKYRYWIMIAVLFTANAFVWSTGTGLGGSELSVSFLDVGQGDAVLVEAPGGKQMLIDGGRGGEVLEKLGEEMPFYDRTLEAVVATHPDADHIGGLTKVLDRYEVELILRSGARSDTDTFRRFSRAVEAEGAKEVAAREGIVVKLSPEASFLVLSAGGETVSDTNDRSITGKLLYGNSSFLLTGDASAAVEASLVAAYGRSLESDVLKVGHHGSKTSSNAAFLARVSPEYTVISAGRENRYGHPHETVLERLESLGAEILGTYDKGTVTFTTDGHTLRLED